MGEQLARELERVPTVRVVVGTYQGANGSQVVVAMGEASTLMSLHSASWPMPGERVVCVNLDGRWMCLGPERPRQRWGVVTALPGSGMTTVEYPPGSGTTANVLLPKGDVAQVGDFALLDWANGGVVVRLYGAAPSAAPAPEPVAPASKPATRLFRARLAGTADGDGTWIRDDLYARTFPQGAAAWLYGDQIAQAVGSRTVTSGRIYIPILSPGSGDILLGYTTLSSKSGVPGIASGQVVKPGGGWFPLPLAVAKALAGSGRGVSLRTNSGGAPVYKSLARDPKSGQVEITYR